MTPEKQQTTKVVKSDSCLEYNYRSSNWMKMVQIRVMVRVKEGVKDEDSELKSSEHAPISSCLSSIIII